MADTNYSSLVLDNNTSIGVDSLLKYNSANSALGIDTADPTYEGYRTQLQAKLSENDNTADLITASTIQTLVDLISAIGDFNGFSVESALQENFFDTAKLSSSIFRLCRNLAIRLQRNIPSQMTCSVYREISTSIAQLPAWSKFTCNGVSYFNRDPIILGLGVTQVDNIMLYQGEPKYEEFISNGSSFQKYEVGLNDRGLLSEDDIKVWVSGVEWERDLRGLYTYDIDSTKFYENTLPSGSVQVKFGDNVYGLSPDLNTTIRIGYVVTKGPDAQAPTTDMEVQVVDSTELKATATSSTYGGEKAKDAYYYQQMGPSLSAVNERAVTRDDYRAYITKYPGVLDGLARGQAEIAPYRKEWMNVLAITAIVDSVWGDTEFKGLTDYLTGLGIAYMQYVRIDPVTSNVNVEGTIYCLPNTNLDNMRIQVENAVQELFRPKVGTLGRGIMVSDIENLILSVGGNSIDYIDLLSPSINYYVDKTEYLRLGNLSINCVFSPRNDTQEYNALKVK